MTTSQMATSAGMKVLPAYRIVDTGHNTVPGFPLSWGQAPKWVGKLAGQGASCGRQRGYLLYFGGAKQSMTSTARVERYAAQILAGKGLHD